MKPARTTWLRLLLAATLAGCGDPALATLDDAIPAASERGTFALEIALDDGAFRRGSNAFEVRATDREGRAGSVVGVSARMPGHPHGVTPPRIDCAEGRCRVSDLVLPMAGRWEITVQLAVTGARDEAVLSPVLR